MLILLALLTAGYLAAAVRVCRGARRRRADPATAEPVAMPAADLPPASAVGWPPTGSQFAAYVDRGLRALDDFLAEGFTA